MRPIDKFRPPRDEEGKLITFKNYQDAKGYMYQYIGCYCSYCERPLSNPAIEHKLSQNKHASLVNKWNNFLFGCINCNSTKRYYLDVKLTDCLWPDRDNTFLAFLYEEGGIVSVNQSLPDKIKAMARLTMEMTGINAKPSSNLIINPQQRDKRWENRRDVWGIATDAKNDLESFKGTDQEPTYRKIIIKLAMANGFWSVWMSVFNDDNQMKTDLITSFIGTSHSSFDGGLNAIVRNNKRGI